MKVVGFTQLHNEMAKGNLENWFRCMNTCCDHIYIYDQASTDGSQDVYKQQDNTVVIQSDINDFQNEIICKGVLLDKLLLDHPDADWIVWLDGDTLLDGRLLKNNGEKFKELCSIGIDRGCGGFRFGHYNLWRSDLHYRVDNSYHSLHNNVTPVWRNTGNLKFPMNTGLHNGQYPEGLNPPFIPTDCNLIHRGFATDYQILTKYEIYKDRGQSGWALDRLLDESTLAVEKITSDILPDWFDITDDNNPIDKERIIEIYEKESRNNITNI